MFNDENVENEIAAVSAIMEKYESTLLTGAHSADKTVAEIVEAANAEFEAAGIQAILDEAQAQIDEFVAAREAQ